MLKDSMSDARVVVKDSMSDARVVVKDSMSDARVVLKDSMSDARVVVKGQGEISRPRRDLKTKERSQGQGPLKDGITGAHCM